METAYVIGMDNFKSDEQWDAENESVLLAQLVRLELDEDEAEQAAWERFQAEREASRDQE